MLLLVYPFITIREMPPVPAPVPTAHRSRSEPAPSVCIYIYRGTYYSWWLWNILVVVAEAAAVAGGHRVLLLIAEPHSVHGLTAAPDHSLQRQKPMSCAVPLRHLCRSRLSDGGCTDVV